MADLEPFIGTRYAPGIPLDRVIAPPYDVVTPEQRHQLAGRHSANAVRVELPEPDRGQDRYRTAAALLRQWRATGTLVDDPAPALYAYRMTTPDGHTSTGVIGALSIDDRDLLPHEETLPKPASDRLDLLRATRANLSPIWGLSLAPGLGRLVNVSSRADAEATDDDGVRHQLWVIADPASVNAIRDHVASAPIVIADGHHRLETARRYHQEVWHPELTQHEPTDLDTGDHEPTDPDTGDYEATDLDIGYREPTDPDPDPAYPDTAYRDADRHETGVVSGLDGGGTGAVLALVTELSSNELHVGAIHRAVTGLAPDADLAGAFRRWFTMVRAGGSDPHTLRAVAGPEGMALITADSTWLLTPRPEAAEAAGNDLDSAAVNLALESLPPHEVTYCHSRQEAADMVGDGRANAAVLLRAVSPAMIAEWARARRRMPPKSTYFTPKPRTGMVFRLLEPGPAQRSLEPEEVPTEPNPTEPSPGRQGPDETFT